MVLLGEVCWGGKADLSAVLMQDPVCLPAQPGGMRVLLAPAVQLTGKSRGDRNVMLNECSGIPLIFLKRVFG